MNFFVETNPFKKTICRKKQIIQSRKNTTNLINVRDYTG